MMLNWKTMTLGQHARVRVTRKENGPPIGPYAISNLKQATVDARWTGQGLEVFGHGSLWPEVEEALAVLGPAQLIDGVHVYRYERRMDPAPSALRDFEMCLRNMMRMPGWTVEEVAL